MEKEMEKEKNIILIIYYMEKGLLNSKENI